VNPLLILTKFKLLNQLNYLLYRNLLNFLLFII